MTPTASDHPATWKFDLPIFHAETRAALREWLAAHHARERGVWLATWKRQSGKPHLPYEEVVEEALCVGWIDSTVNSLDEERRLQLLTPRKPKSSWTRLNRERVARLEEQGLMTDAGRRALDVARANGWLTRFDAAEDLSEPDDLVVALDSVPAARANWDGFPPSARKQMLWSILSVERAESRAKRIAAIVDAAKDGRRLGQ